ncbi:MAG TPA: DNA replication protein DnaC [Lachnospiraceae bacterium]|nr:DNA replication protein DnaC [Lachnospiraceae bacterium]
MPSKSALYKEIIRYYDEVRTASAARLREKRMELYSKLPRIEEIDNEISMAGITMAKAVLNTPSDAVEIANSLKESLAKLTAEKEGLLQENGLSANYLEMEYQCPICKDTGFVGDSRCTCFSQRLVDLAYNSSNIKAIVKQENFDSFDLSYYSPSKETGEEISPRENIQRILSACLKFTKSFGKTFDNLLLYGSPGLGKTFLCNCIARELLDRGITVMYVTASQLFKAIEKERFNRSDEEDCGDYLEDVLGVDLLIIDDLGTEFTTVFTVGELFNIINTRFLNKKPVIISTNLALKDLSEKYSDRLTSRLMGGCITLKFFGEDIRILKKFRK